MITLETITSQLTAGGAVLEVWNSPASHHLVGEFRWLGTNRVFWFPAHGDREDDGHLLEFEAAELVNEREVHFLRNGRMVGRLTDIERATVEDHEDYSVAFTLWEQVAPRTRALIDRSREKVERLRTEASGQASRVGRTDIFQ